MAATIARLVREIRCEARPGERQHIRAAAKWAAQAGYELRPDFAFAEMHAADAWGDLPKAAAKLLLRIMNLETTAAKGLADATDAVNSDIDDIIALCTQKLVHHS